MILGIITQTILIIPIIKFIYLYFILPLIKPNPVRKYYEEGAYALITGSSDGIGKSYAYILAKEGFNLILIARRENLLQEIKKDIEEKYKVQVIIKSVDLIKATDETFEEIGKFYENYNVKILINNAAMTYQGFATFFNGYNMEGVHDVIRLNVWASLKISYPFVNLVKKEKNYLIVYMSSCTSKFPVPTGSIYSSTKAFVRQFSSCLSCEYDNIDVTCFSPWNVSTAMINNSPVNIATCSPDTFVEYAMKFVGLVDEIDPYIVHNLEDWGWWSMPLLVQKAADRKSVV